MEEAQAKAEAMLKKGSFTAQNAVKNALKGLGSFGRSAQGKQDLTMEPIYTLSNTRRHDQLRGQLLALADGFVFPKGLFFSQSRGT